MSLSFSGDIDYSSVEQAITSITTNLPEMSQGVRVLAALTPSGDHLLDAARKLCFAFTDLLKAVQPDSNTVCIIDCSICIYNARCEIIIYEKLF